MRSAPRGWVNSGYSDWRPRSEPKGRGRLSERAPGAAGWLLPVVLSGSGPQSVIAGVQPLESLLPDG